MRASGTISIAMTDPTPEGEITVFARFHALPGREAEVEAAIRQSVAASSREPGCRLIQGFRSLRDAQLFFIHSRWVDEAAFELHAVLPHTVHFLATVPPLIDHSLDVTRSARFTE
jgi:quinol monooxygenase YgiN